MQIFPDPIVTFSADIGRFDRHGSVCMADAQWRTLTAGNVSFNEFSFP